MTQSRIAATHGWFNHICQVAPMLAWAHPSPHPKWHLNLFSCFCTAHGGIPILYNGQPLLPSKLPQSHGDLDPHHLIHGSLVPPESKTQMAS